MIWLLACTSTFEREHEASVRVEVEAPGLLDPKLEGEPSLKVRVRREGDAQGTLRLLAVQGGREVLLGEGEDAELVVDWDGAGLAPGPVELVGVLEADQGQAVGVAEAGILRLGVVAIDFHGEDTAPLAYHRSSLSSGLDIQDLGGVPEWLSDRVSEGELADLDLDSGQPRPGPEVWADTDFPPWGSGEPGGLGLGSHNLPSAWLAGGRPQVSAHFGSTAVSPEGLAVDAGAPGVLVLAGADELEGLQDWVPGAERSWRMTEAASAALGRDEQSLTWRFFAVVDGEPVAIPGHQTTTHARYVLVDQPWTADGEWLGASPNVAWVGVLEDVNASVGGLSADQPEDVLTALRDGLHFEPWLVYNPGDSGYSDFEGSYIYWDYIWFDMSGWLARDDGVDLYCHSLACLLSAQANQVGIEAEYVTLAQGFTTHMVRAAGTEDWRRWSFNSHGVVGYDGRIWDAAVDYDGDDDPDAAPHTPVAATGVEFEAYLDLLTADEIGQVNGGRCVLY
jgi:hypothetical protein